MSDTRLAPSSTGTSAAWPRWRVISHPRVGSAVDPADPRHGRPPDRYDDQATKFPTSIQNYSAWWRTPLSRTVPRWRAVPAQFSGHLARPGRNAAPVRPGRLPINAYPDAANGCAV